MRIVVVLSALACLTLAAPNHLEGLAPPEPAGYSYPAPAVGLVEGAVPAAAGEGAAVVGIVRDDRVFEETGAYSFDVAGEDGTARQESGAPLAEGGISQTGSYSYTQPDGNVFELKYVADVGGFQPESAALPPLPEFVLEQIEFAKNNPEPEGVDGAALAAPHAGYLPPAPVAPESSYLPPAPAAPAAPKASYVPPVPAAPAAPKTSYVPPVPAAPATLETSYVAPVPAVPEASYVPPVTTTPAAPKASYVPPVPAAPAAPAAPEASYVPPVPAAPKFIYFIPRR